jgi:hypothetical protein
MIVALIYARKKVREIMLKIRTNIRKEDSTKGKLMKKAFLLVFALMLLTSMAYAQTGSVSGTVRDTLNNPVDGASISLMRPHDPDHFYHTFSGSDGTFSISEVEAGFYMAEASKMMVGHDEDSVTVVAGENSVIDFVLGGGHNPPPPPTGTGSVSGTVSDTLGNPVDNAMISLMSMGGGDHHHGGGMGRNYYTFSNEDGTFSIDSVAAGSYTAMASKMLVGHDAEEISVADSQITEVNFVLSNFGCHDRGGMHGDSLEIVNLTGWAIVIQDSLRAHYFLDTNGDDTADFRLEFGPPWYDPGSGAQRPADGDSIWITGGLLGYGRPQMVVVYEINGLFWRQPGHGHGGHGGYGGGYPHPDSLVRIEATGQAIIRENPMRDTYFLDTNYDDTADYVLNFGPPNYDPGNGATRPNDGDTVAIVGGLMDGWMDHLPMIIVYEIDGQFWWRDPGDTLDLWPMVTSTDDPVAPALPTDYLVARSYPNPFNPTAIISFDLASPANVKVAIYDLLGREVAILAEGAFPSGQNQVLFTPSQSANSAVYFYKVTAGNRSVTGKMILLK